MNGIKLEVDCLGHGACIQTGRDTQSKTLVAYLEVSTGCVIIGYAYKNGTTTRVAVWDTTCNKKVNKARPSTEQLIVFELVKTKKKIDDDWVSSDFPIWADDAMRSTIKATLNNMKTEANSMPIAPPQDICKIMLESDLAELFANSGVRDPVALMEIACRVIIRINRPIR